MINSVLLNDSSIKLVALNDEFSSNPTRYAGFPLFPFPPFFFILAIAFSIVEYFTIEISKRHTRYDVNFVFFVKQTAV